MTRNLTEAELEQALEMLAVAINAAGSEKETLFLSKLCFTLANALGDLGALEEAIAIVNKDL